MTKKALKKLSEEQLEYLKTASVLLDQARKNNLKEEFERNAGKLRGFFRMYVPNENYFRYRSQSIVFMVF